MNFFELPSPADCADRAEFVRKIQVYLIERNPEKYADRIYAMNVARMHAIPIWNKFVEIIRESNSDW